MSETCPNCAGWRKTAEFYRLWLVDELGDNREDHRRSQALAEALVEKAEDGDNADSGG